MTQFLTPSITFSSGSYPNQPMPVSAINLLLDNANMSAPGDPFNFVGRQVQPMFQHDGSLAVIDVTEATSGTWSTIMSFGSPNYGLPYFVHFQMELVIASGGNNAVFFSLWRNGVQVGKNIAEIIGMVSARHIIGFNKLVPVSGAAGSFDNFDLKWQIGAAGPAMTARLNKGYRVMAHHI